MVFNGLAEIAEEIRIWPPLTEPDPSIILQGSKAEVRVLEALVKMVESQEFDARKNKLPHLVHPLSVTHYLQKANSSFLVQCAGVLHDYIEEIVDYHAADFGLITSSSKNFNFFDLLESQLLIGLEGDLGSIFGDGPVSGANPLNVTETVGLLTRYKRHRYYESVNGIFTCTDEEIRDAGIELKLADRKHNILTLDSFNEQQAVYQCFKNMFILNEAKKHLRRTNQLTSVSSSEMTSTEKLFRKCGKATYDALWYVTQKASGKINSHAILTLELAFQKFDKMYGRLGQVTTPNPHELHPLRLFQGVVLKYDSHLHKEEEEFERREADERKYCSGIFAKEHFSPDQIKALIAFKDAFALKVVMGNLLYDKDYNIEGFGCSTMCSRGRKCLSGPQD
jgi:hypothetical protein